jgi:hypothetical protein
MRERSAKKVGSGWSAFRLGMTRPELSVLGVGEWDRPGGDDWGVMIRDLRTGEERVVFDEAEWERIKKRGLPPIGQPWGEPLMSRPGLSRQVESSIETQRRMYEAGTRPDEQPDRQLVAKLTHCLTQVVEVPFSVDDRESGYLLPVGATLKRSVFVDWSKTDYPDVHTGLIFRGQAPLPVLLGRVQFSWPAAPDKKALAYKAAEWLLILEGRQKTVFQVKHGPTKDGIASVEFVTFYNGFGSCVMDLIDDPL